MHVGKLRTRKRSAPTREKRHRSGCRAFRETRSGRSGRSSRGSRVAHQPEDRYGSAIARAILQRAARLAWVTTRPPAVPVVAQSNVASEITCGCSRDWSAMIAAARTAAWRGTPARGRTSTTARLSSIAQPAGNPGSSTSGNIGWKVRGTQTFQVRSTVAAWARTRKPRRNGSGNGGRTPAARVSCSMAGIVVAPNSNSPKHAPEPGDAGPSKSACANPRGHLISQSVFRPRTACPVSP